ncbi:MAG: hypothetical protein MSIBF_00735 [Candidatus Altiarchaeales archaeon IMC4]|nr:MAG: hypothetical protein MSIBF_00735 [Candidatus Altiarchaeales archaeon IMC4]
MELTHPLVKKGIELRRYQESIISQAIGKNTLVVLPTGLGKTMIAAMVAVHRLSEFPESRILFLAPTKPLAVQHQRTFSELLAVEGQAVLTGAENPEKRSELWQQNKLLFATPQTIENDMLRGLDISDVSLLVFDEAHRATGDYSYVYIAREYAKRAKNPLVLGLTASPGADGEKIKEVCNNLFIENVEVKTESDADVRDYVQDVRIDWVKVELPQEFVKVKELLESVLKDDLNELKGYGYIKSAQVKGVNKRMLLEAQSQIRKEITSGKESFAQASIAASAIKVQHAIELAETQGMASLDSYLGRLSKQHSKAVKFLLADDRINKAISLARGLRELGVEHPKFDELVKIVKNYADKKVIIFTQYRDSVDKIVEKLSDNKISARDFVGQATKDGKNGMTQKQQVAALEDFRKGRFTALVATSVAEEGLDIPAVDLVVFYEPIPSEIRSIQRRGRTGRSAAGKVVMLMAKNTRDEAYYWAGFHKERRMHSEVEKMKSGFKGVKETVSHGSGDVVGIVLAGQKSLMEYAVAGEEPGIKIYVDTRERTSSVARILKEKANIEIRQLPVGDFILSDRVGVERKTKEDFIQSIIDKRLNAQAVEMMRNFRIPILILEGTEDIYALRNIHPNAIRGALAALSVGFGISVIPSKNEEDTAEILYTIAKREQEDDERYVPLRGERKPQTLNEMQRYVVESLPNVSAVLARRLLEKFKTVEKVMRASEKQLKKIEGIGDKKAQEIRRVLGSEYEKE